MSIIAKHSFLGRAQDDEGYPSMEFEFFYQQGLSCFTWNLPKKLRRQAFKHLCNSLLKKGAKIAMWQVRAFIYGCHGLCGDGQRERRVSADFQWPLPPDNAWKMIICVYPDGKCDLDFVHPVSREFWSERNGFLSLPCYDPNRMGAMWFEEMGFEVMVMRKAMSLSIAKPGPHLTLATSTI